MEKLILHKRFRHDSIKSILQPWSLRNIRQMDNKCIIWQKHTVSASSSNLSNVCRRMSLKLTVLQTLNHWTLPSDEALRLTWTSLWCIIQNNDDQDATQKGLRTRWLDCAVCSSSASVNLEEGIHVFSLQSLLQSGLPLCKLRVLKKNRMQMLRSRKWNTSIAEANSDWVQLSPAADCIFSKAKHSAHLPLQCLNPLWHRLRIWQQSKLKTIESVSICLQLFSC